jgi:N-methylhydantoinase A
VVPPFPGTFSAWGMLLTEPRIDRVRTRVLPLASTPAAELERLFAESEAEAIAALTAQGFAAADIPPPRRGLDMRYHGQEHTVEVPIAGSEALATESLTAAFHERHRRRYTFALEDTPVEIVNIRVTATASIARPALGASSGSGAADPLKGTRLVHFGDGPLQTRVYDRSLLPAGFAGEGPAIVEEPSTTTVVHPGQRFSVDEAGNLIVVVG